MLPLAALLSGAIGVLLGLLGGGGSILMLPMLVFVLAVPARDAIAASLLVVGVTSLVGLIVHARSGRVDWRVGLLFGASGMAGAYVAGRAAHLVPAGVLLAGFGAMMLAASVGMLRVPAAHRVRRLSVGKVVLLGALVGAVSGLVGAGGGFLVVPALTLLGGLATPTAIATSLLVIATQSLAGFAGHATHAHLDPVLLGVLVTTASAGSFIGVRLSRHASPEALRKGFGWLVLGMGIFLLASQLPPSAVRRFAPIATAFAALALVSLSPRTSRNQLSHGAPS